MKITRTAQQLLAPAILLALVSACSKSEPPATESPKPPATNYSMFGEYQPLEKWSGWCGSAIDDDTCKKPLQDAVGNQTPNSRPTVRNHAWGLWAGIIKPIENGKNDVVSYTTTQFGTKGCWNKLGDETTCSGNYPIWMTWPNTGKPMASVDQPSDTPTPGSLLQINKRFVDTNVAHGALLNGGNRLLGMDKTANYANPTQVQTVNTTASSSSIPKYDLPVAVVIKNCELPAKQAKTLVDNANNSSGSQATKAWNQLQTACSANGHPDVICADSQGVCDGSTFVNQGDVMIASESLSEQAWQAVQSNDLYDSKTLKKFYKNKDTDAVSTVLPDTFISTKHMFWPVKGCKPGVKVGEAGCRIRYGALPAWIPSEWISINYATDSAYRGYETWDKVVAIDTCGEDCPDSLYAELTLTHVKNAAPITTHNPKVFPADAFVHIQVSEEALQTGFTETDRALLDQATIWAYGDKSGGFEAGDFLVVAAMHINTKEIDSWAFQSVWWSPMDDTLDDCPVQNVKNCFGQSDAYGAKAKYSGLSPDKIKRLDDHVGSKWRDYYVLTDSYGIQYEINGSEASAVQYFNDTPPAWANQRPDGHKVGQLPVSMNVYIEPVIHPLGTNCQNCHRRAGIISAGASTPKSYQQGIGATNYQTAQCPSLLADYNTAGADPCMNKPWVNNSNSWQSADVANQCKPDPSRGVLCDGKNAYPIVNTDTTWFIADGHIQQAADTEK
ncbi:Uncharacterised protein [BD1-7 clade bacterium]|uniref:GH16 domain-containing protein n=1 Tax=BD1-7 clade bacterium TaxID=2029982 RepID=A0A5S9NVM6_9GAMM|nr:Uncharacterised protein [BD1-7 clade bacterium]CAA0095426.1 Uncharacterised protein [BD1-7 clade bacterium]